MKDHRGRPFLPAPIGEGRYVFALAIDGFNLYHMKQGKQKYSSTGIFLVLLNLPPHLRYLEENMLLVGCIPGKPSLHKINHAVHLLTNKLNEFYFPGVFFSRTYNHKSGILALGLLGPLVADMLTACQAAGLPAPVAHICCTVCNCDLDDIGVVDRAQWPMRDGACHHQLAERWRDARSEAEQDEIFHMYGVRWSALLSLPYWDPIQWTVVEPMHINMNLIKHHIMTAFKINFKPNSTGGDGLLSKPRKVPSAKTALAIIRLAELDMEEQLLKIRDQNTVQAVCMQFGINGGHSSVIGNKTVLVQYIRDWVSALTRLVTFGLTRLLAQWFVYRAGNPAAVQFGNHNARCDEVGPSSSRTVGEIGGQRSITTAQCILEPCSRCFYGRSSSRRGRKEAQEPGVHWKPTSHARHAKHFKSSLGCQDGGSDRRKNKISKSWLEGTEGTKNAHQRAGG